MYSENPTVCICLIARSESARLPNKVNIEIDGITVLDRMIDNLKRCKFPNIRYFVCTTDTEGDDSLVKRIEARGDVEVVRGDVLSVFSRMRLAGEQCQAEVIVRATGDNIFTDPVYLDKLIETHVQENAEYSRVDNLPVGCTAEVMNFDSLKKCYAKENPNHSEYMTLHMFNPESFKCVVMDCADMHKYPSLNLSLDSPEDLQLISEVFNRVPNYELSSVVSEARSIIGNTSEEINEDRPVKLIDKVVTLREYKEYHRSLVQKSIQVSLTDNWYNDTSKNY